MTTSWTDEELEQKIAYDHRMINPGETMTIVIRHKDVVDDEQTAFRNSTTGELNAFYRRSDGNIGSFNPSEADHVLIYFRDGKPAWKRLKWRGKKTIDLGNGTLNEIDDYDYGVEV